MQNQSTNKLLIHISHKILSISNCSFQRYAGVVSDSHSEKTTHNQKLKKKAVAVARDLRSAERNVSLCRCYSYSTAHTSLLCTDLAAHFNLD